MASTRGGRPVRGSALRANQVWTAENATNGFSSGGEEDGEGAKMAARQGRAQRAAPVSHKAPGGVELSKLEASALHKYRKFFQLGDASPSCPKDDLIPGVLRHFTSLVVEEEVVLSRFVMAIQRQAAARSQPHGVQKPTSRK